MKKKDKTWEEDWAEWKKGISPKKVQGNDHKDAQPTQENGWTQGD